MSPSRPLVEALRDLRAVLDRESVRWYVFGAQAVLFYGRPRLTTDLDVTLEGPLDRAEALIPVLADSGFEPRSTDPPGTLHRTRTIPLLHPQSGLAVDLVVAGPGLEQEFLTHRRFLNMGSLEVPVISPEDLIVTKLLSGRPKDLEDVRGVLLEQVDHLDLDRVRHFLGLIEGAIDRSDLLPTLERLLPG